MARPRLPPAGSTSRAIGVSGGKAPQGVRFHVHQPRGERSREAAENPWALATPGRSCNRLALMETKTSCAHFLLLVQARCLEDLATALALHRDRQRGGEGQGTRRIRISVNDSSSLGRQDTPAAGGTAKVPDMQATRVHSAATVSSPEVAAAVPAAVPADVSAGALPLWLLAPSARRVLQRLGPEARRAGGRRGLVTSGVLSFALFLRWWTHVVRIWRNLLSVELWATWKGLF